MGKIVRSNIAWMLGWFNCRSIDGPHGQYKQCLWGHKYKHADFLVWSDMAWGSKLSYNLDIINKNSKWGLLVNICHALRLTETTISVN